LGRCPEQFWRLTPREIAAVFDGERDREFKAYELAYYQAYHSGYYSQMQKKFPKYDPPKRQKAGQSPGRQTPQQMKMIAMTLNAAFGGEFRKRDDG